MNKIVIEENAKGEITIDTEITPSFTPQMSGNCSTHIGMSAMEKAMMDRKNYNIFIGINTGTEVDAGTDIVIIGDNIMNTIKGQKDVLYVSDKLLIGKYLFGQPNPCYYEKQLKK